MDDQTRFVHVHRTLTRPCGDFFPVRTGVSGAICSRFEFVLLPTVDDEPDICMAHGEALERVEAVVC